METNIKGMTTCKVCGRDFPLLIESHYVSIEGRIEGIVSAIGRISPQLYDSFDCPLCGCQNRMQLRNRETDVFGNDLSDMEKSCCCTNSETELR